MQKRETLTVTARLYPLLNVFITLFYLIDFITMFHLNCAENVKHKMVKIRFFNNKISYSKV